MCQNQIVQWLAICAAAAVGPAVAVELVVPMTPVEAVGRGARNHHLHVENLYLLGQYGAMQSHHGRSPLGSCRCPETCRSLGPYSVHTWLQVLAYPASLPLIVRESAFQPTKPAHCLRNDVLLEVAHVDLGISQLAVDRFDVRCRRRNLVRDLLDQALTSEWPST